MCIRDSYKGAYGAVLVYDITRPNTFEALDKWIDDFRENAGEEAVVLIVGNKSDLEAERQISTQQGLEYANSRGLAFLETSAKEGTNIENAFERLVQEIYNNMEDDEEEEEVIQPTQSRPVHQQLSLIHI
eukprot:TRINITY_DN1064_c0_g1_i6.p2 TRINITY_DN1064_c0_g1~~TRINITY_DN1064_c0_g1_i6.p2  ORF type:complete len:145 (-),score=28.04 TRINITY_DN1064_c0_g1_i6:61-450(-)